MISNFLIYGSIFVAASTLMVSPLVTPTLWEPQHTTGQQTTVVLNEETDSQYAQAYSVGLNSMIARAGSGITDEETARFYGKLVKGYELDKPQSEAQRGSGLAGLVPDIRGIEYQALTLPLSEAGKGITDPEIADFYSGFVKRCGLER